MNTTTVPLVEQNIITLHELTAVLSMAQYQNFNLVICGKLCFCLLVLLRSTFFDSSFGIFKLFSMICSDSVREINQIKLIKPSELFCCMLTINVVHCQYMMFSPVRLYLASFLYNKFSKTFENETRFFLYPIRAASFLSIVLYPLHSFDNIECKTSSQ